MAVMMSTLLVDRRDDRTALITVNPAGRHHATLGFLHDLPAALAALDEDPQIRACVISDADGALAADDDIDAFHRPIDSLTHRRQARLALGALRALERADTVTVAAIDGLVSGAATEVVLACTHTLASTSAAFGFAREEIDAEEALRIGIVQRVVAPEELIDQALAVARRTVAGP